MLVAANTEFDASELGLPVRDDFCPVTRCQSVGNLPVALAIRSLPAAGFRPRMRSLRAKVASYPRLATQRNPMWVVAVSCDWGDRAAGR